MSMGYYLNETDARTDIVGAIKPIYGNCALFVAERNAVNLGLREVIFVARVPKDDAKSEAAVNALFALQIAQPAQRLEWQGTKVDFLNDNETEYLMIKAVVTNGN
jgi:hypothetical protein